MFINDPCGIACIIVTYLSVLYADYVIIKWVVLHTMLNSLWGAFNVVLFNTVVLLLGMSHIRAVITDPGIIPITQSKEDLSDLTATTDIGCELVNWTICTRCETYRPPRAHHCRICQRCIRRMDHHCPWINNCVGEGNQKYFIQFLVYVGILSFYAITLIVTSWLSECKDCVEDMPIKQARMMHSVILLLESALFGMFVSAILIDQLQAILTDETAIEQIQHQGPHRPHKPKMALLSEVFGREHPFLWLLPCSSVPRKFNTPLLQRYNRVKSFKACVTDFEVSDLSTDACMSFNCCGVADTIPFFCFGNDSKPTANHLPVTSRLNSNNSTKTSATSLNI